MYLTPITVPQASPSATWTITHALGVRPSVSVKVLISGVLTEILPSSVSFPDVNTVIIGFSTPYAGEARLA